MLSRLVITFLPRSKCLLISCLQSPSAVILESKNIKSATVSTVSPSICHEVMGPDAMILVFWLLGFKPTFSFSSFTLIRSLFSSLLSAIRVVPSLCMSKVIDISHGNLDSSLCFIQPSVSHDVLLSASLLSLTLVWSSTCWTFYLAVPLLSTSVFKGRLHCLLLEATNLTFRCFSVTETGHPRNITGPLSFVPLGNSFSNLAKFTAWVFKKEYVLL